MASGKQNCESRMPEEVNLGEDASVAGRSRSRPSGDPAPADPGAAGGGGTDGGLPRPPPSLLGDGAGLSPGDLPGGGDRGAGAGVGGAGGRALRGRAGGRGEPWGAVGT